MLALCKKSNYLFFLIGENISNTHAVRNFLANLADVIFYCLYIAKGKKAYQILFHPAIFVIFQQLEVPLIAYVSMREVWKLTNFI